MILAHLTLPLIIGGVFPQFNLVALLIGANISSLDALPTLLRTKPPKVHTEETHAATILHTLFFFVIAFFPLLILGFPIALSFMVGGFSHIFIDALDEKGRMLCYPFSRKFYGPDLLTYDFWTYTTDKKIFTLEASLFLVTCALWLFK